MNLFEFDRTFLSEEIEVIVGADEVGRGTLAGPVVASMVILPDVAEFDEEFITELNDSKQMSQKKREKFYEIIKSKARAIATCFIDEKKIDEINILNATKLAMQNCLKDILQICKADILLIDGNFLIDANIKQKSVVKGDAKSASIASASIIAKVERDRFMEKLDCKYPVYGFKDHKGYGSKTHIDAIKKYGPCEIHRKSFSPVSDFFSKQMELGI